MATGEIKINRFQSTRSALEKSTNAGKKMGYTFSVAKRKLHMEISAALPQKFPGRVYGMDIGYVFVA